jgi:hypothetical protein
MSGSWSRSNWGGIGPFRRLFAFAFAFDEDGEDPWSILDGDRAAAVGRAEAVAANTIHAESVPVGIG